MVIKGRFLLLLPSCIGEALPPQLCVVYRVVTLHIVHLSSRIWFVPEVAPPALQGLSGISEDLAFCLFLYSIPPFLKQNLVI